MSDLSVGIVGLGSMGMGMANNVVAAGLPVKGFDVFEKARDTFQDNGGVAVESAAEAATDVDVLLLMVVNAHQADEVLFGGGGAADAATKGTVVMVCCTIAPKDAREIAGKLDERGLVPLDAPVSGGKVGAESGQLSIFASGPESAFAKAGPILDAVSKKVYRLGDTPGLGSSYKVVHQLAAGVHLAVACEVMAFGVRAGCDPDILFDIVKNSAGRSWMFEDRVPHMLDDDFEPRSAVDIFVKDMGLVHETAEDVRISLPLASTAYQLFLAASGAGYGRIDDCAVVKVYEQLTGIRVARNEQH